MKKILLSSVLMALFCMISISSEAQVKKPNRIFKQGQFDVYSSIGLAPTFLADKGKSIVPPIILGADYMVSDNFSLGLSLGHSVTQTKQELFSDGLFGTWRNSTFEASAKAGLHVTRFDNMSIYGGFTLNYNLARITASHEEMDEIAHHRGILPERSTFVPGGYIGFKYAVSPKVTLNSELGFSGISIFRVGAGFRL